MKKKDEVLFVKKPLNRAKIPNKSVVPRLFTGAQRFRNDSVPKLKAEAPHDFPPHSLADRAKLLEDARYVCMVIHIDYLSLERERERENCSY